MSELFISLLFAFLFIMAYLGVRKLRNSKSLGASSLPELFQATGKSSNALRGQKPTLFLTTKELSEHHSKGGQTDSRNQGRR